MPNGAQRIVQERLRQKIEKGYRETDAAYTQQQLLQAAVSYLCLVMGDELVGEQDKLDSAQQWWPWDQAYLKPGTATRNLEKAGALIAAELDRLLALQQECDEASSSSL